MGINMRCFPCGMLGTNCYVIYNENKNAIIIDLEEESDALTDFVLENKLDVKMILLTHPHFDHMRGIMEMKKITGAKVLVCKDAVEYDENGNAFVKHGLKKVLGQIVPDEYFADGDVLYLDNTPIEIFVGNGHSKADAVFKIGDNLFTGDALFHGTIGRTDLENGDYDSLVKFVRGLKRFGEDTKVYPGHGESTTIGNEMKINKYMMGD